MTEDEVVQLYRQHGWNDTNAILGDIRAGNWQSKVSSWTGSGGGGGGSIGAFTFDQAAAEKNALAELAPYYEKLLTMYGGDVALAKQRLDQDYERGLRVKTEDTEWQQSGVTAEKDERQRKFKLALGDLDQQMNQRGVYTSGIRTAETERATADEAYQQSQLARQEQALTTGLQQYKEQAGAEYQKEAENLGYAKPMAQSVTGEFAPNTAGQVSPFSQANISGYASQPAQKVVALDQEKKDKAIQMALTKRGQEYEKYMTDAQRLARG